MRVTHKSPGMYSVENVTARELNADIISYHLTMLRNGTTPCQNRHFHPPNKF